jgi:hypothetical protein
VKRFLLLLAFTGLCLGACKTMTSGVSFERKTDAPELGGRGDGCYVEIFELGNEPERAYQVVGVMTLELSNEQIKNGQGEDVARRFKEAACGYGAFMVKDIKTYPEPTSGRVLYEAKAAVFLDENGKPILQKTHEEASTQADALEDAKAGVAEAQEALGVAADAGPAE